MSTNDNLSRLKHILDACQEALSFIDGYSQADVNTNRMLGSKRYIGIIMIQFLNPAQPI